MEVTSRGMQRALLALHAALAVAPESLAAAMGRNPAPDATPALQVMTTHEHASADDMPDVAAHSAARQDATLTTHESLCSHANAHHLCNGAHANMP